MRQAGHKPRPERIRAMATVINSEGHELDFESAVQYMDDDIREELHRDMAPCGEQEFFTAYEKAHAAKFGEPLELSKVNPIW